MATYEPIYLTANKREEEELSSHMDILLSGYLYLDDGDDDVSVYVRKIGDTIELRPAEGKLESISFSSQGVSMPASFDAEKAEFGIDGTIYRIYFRPEKNPFSA